MTGDSALSPHHNLHITIEEVSENSGNLLDGEGDELENGCEQLFELEGDENDAERGGKTDHYFDIESNGAGDVANGHLFDVESNGHGDDGGEANEQLFEIGDIGDDDNKNDLNVIDAQTGFDRSKIYPPPIVGMEFESYEDAYGFYNCYAKDIGFAIRVKSSWTKRNSKDKRGAVLCCNCEGFKTIKEANRRRKESRTGCLAMVRLRLVESNRWRVDEVKLEHNHLFDPERASNSKSHKRLDTGLKRKAEPELDVEVRTIKLYRTPASESIGYISSNSYRGESDSQCEGSKQLRLGNGDSQLITNFFSGAQLTDPNFFYVMDFNDEGYLKNMFWIDSRARAAYSYFGDVVSFDTTSLSYNYETPLVEFVGVNHHGETVLLGCGLLADETLETYVWLLRAWLTCLLGRPPQTIITNQCKTLQAAIAEVFPRAHHRLCLPNIVQSILENLRGLPEYEAFQMVLLRTLYDSPKVEDFELAWEDMIQRFGIASHELLRFVYEDRDRWAPVYSRDTIFAGMFDFWPCMSTTSYFHGYIHEKTSLKEFFEITHSVLEKKRRKEALDDSESRDPNPTLKTTSYYEAQLAQLYTKSVFGKFQDEVVTMSLCFDISQVNANGSVSTYMVKERRDGEGNFEVMYDKAGSEVRCACGCFNLRGYLCRHALCVLNYNGVEEIPFQYVLSRWRKDFRRLYVPELGSNSVDTANPVQWFDHLYRKSMQVVEEGMSSQDHYMVAWLALKESLNKVRLVVPDKHV